ncbi:MAG: aspartyl/glutamyl-tRNA amidotransferase subunit A [Treponema sp.]|jgi:aspartyl-tRNA(Asn)/glutamyl-tRNA(Gln) amidotransferase subunit A|nr:aspartyl/glutamyl-tRNA amidotransferase subunit A [Treponema sp.]
MEKFALPDAFLPYFEQWEQAIGAFTDFKAAGLQPDDDDRDLPSTAPSTVPSAVPPAAPPEAAALIRGLPCAVKDLIAVKGFSLTCGSRLLAKLKAPYTATAVRRLEAAGAVVIGKTNMDEFGMGSSTDASGIQRTNNPWDTSRVAGGSSGGSAACVAAGQAPYALGSDTGGSVRQPAALCGVVGLKPTYGAVSRYGLVAYASSLETIGVLSDTVARCRAVFAALRGADPLDETSRDAPAAAPPLYGPGTGPDQPRRIAVLSAEAIAKAIAAAAAGGRSGEAVDASVLMIAAGAAALEPEVQRGFDAAKERLAVLGHRLEEVDIPALKYGVSAYYTIATAEASANLARFDGIRYGQRPGWAENPGDLVDKTREAGFGPEVKLRILLGTFVLRSGFQDRYYLQAQRIRAGIRAAFEQLLGGSEYLEGSPKYDAILMPVFPTRAVGRGDTGLSPFAQKAADLYTCCANLAGLPALAFPVGIEGGLPVGVQLLGRAFAEGTLLDIAQGFEAAHPFPHPPGFKAFWGTGAVA